VAAPTHLLFYRAPFTSSPPNGVAQDKSPLTAGVLSQPASVVQGSITCIFVLITIRGIKSVGPVRRGNTHYSRCIYVRSSFVKQATSLIAMVMGRGVLWDV
jgi:hypothetical protein